MRPDRPAAGYLTITGGSEADALIAASSPIASDTQVHETTAGMSGMAGMQEVDRIEVTAGTTVRLEPGGYHIMFMDPDATMLTVGETVEITLTFETAGDVTVEAEVRAG
jgi:copper(I)-binding protein